MPTDIDTYQHKVANLHKVGLIKDTQAQSVKTSACNVSLA